MWLEGENMADQIIIYGKAGWPYTDKARSAFGGKAVYIDVIANPDKLPEMLKVAGGARQVPVIVQNGKVSIGYGGSWGV